MAKCSSDNLGVKTCFIDEDGNSSVFNCTYKDGEYKWVKLQICGPSDGNCLCSSDEEGVVGCYNENGESCGPSSGGGEGEGGGGTTETHTCWKCEGTVAKSISCSADDDCGSGSCSGYPHSSRPTCTGECAQSGESCSSDSDCCSGLICCATSGTCEQASNCCGTGTGQACEGYDRAECAQYPLQQFPRCGDDTHVYYNLKEVGSTAGCNVGTVGCICYNIKKCDSGKICVNGGCKTNVCGTGTGELCEGYEDATCGSDWPQGNMQWCDVDVHKWIDAYVVGRYGCSNDPNCQNNDFCTCICTRHTNDYC